MSASRLAPRNLNQALGWLLAGVIVPLLLGALALLVVQARQEQAFAQEQLSTLARTLVQAVDRELDYGRAQLEVIAASQLMDQRNWPELHRFGREVAARRPGSLIVLVGPDGQLLVNTAVPWGEPLPNVWKLGDQQREAIWQGRSLPLSSQDLTRGVFERGQVVYSDLYYGVNVQRPTLALSVPVIRGGRVPYALTLSFPPSLLQDMINSAVHVPGLRAAVVDRRGLVVASNAAAASRLGDRIRPIRIPPGSVAGTYDNTTRDGATVRGAYAVSAVNGFVVRVSLPQGGALAAARSVSIGWLLLVLAALAASVLLAGSMGRRLARPLNELGQAAREGRPPPEALSSGIAEIALLADALRAGADAERRRGEEHVLRRTAEQQEALVKASEARLKRVLDQLFVFVGVLDLQGRLVECNASPLQRAGIHAKEVLGRQFWDCYWWEHDPAVAAKVRHAAKEAARGRTSRFDATGRFAHGNLLTVDVQIAPLRDEAGRITDIIASGVDVEGRVRALRELEHSESRALEAARRFDAANRLLEATLEAAPVGIALADREGRVLRINQAGAELWGIADSAERTLTGELLRDRGRAHGLEALPLLPEQWPLNQALRQRRAVTSTIDIAPSHPAAPNRTVLMSAAPVLDAAGGLLGGVVVQVDITQRVEAEAALRLADRQKDEFLATLAHELRNPLAPIRTAVELIRRREPADATVQRARDVIERQLTHLTRLVDDLLDVSRITMGTIHLRQELLDLTAVASGAAESVRPAVDASGVTLDQQLPPAPLRVMGDGTRLAQCIVNLLNNAVKFTPRGGRIGLRVRQQERDAVVEVSDTGIGIAAGNLDRIFDLFVQEQTSGLHGNTGLGIGLALTRKLMALHGGTVQAASPGAGQGSTFVIRLPLVTGPDLLEHAANREGAMPHGAGARVLVVDDNADAADMLAEMLAMSGFSTLVAYDGAGAVRAANQHQPDAVLLDIGLPDIDGYEVCRRIRGAQEVRQPVLVALTGWGQDRDRDQASAAGFDAHVSKPADPDRLIALLQELLAARGECAGAESLRQ